MSQRPHLPKNMTEAPRTSGQAGCTARAVVRHDAPSTTKLPAPGASGHGARRVVNRVLMHAFLSDLCWKAVAMVVLMVAAQAADSNPQGVQRSGLGDSTDPSLVSRAYLTPM